MARPPSPCPSRHPCSTFEHVFSLLDRGERDRTGLFWAEGLRSVHSAVSHGLKVRLFVVCTSLLRGRRFPRLPAPTITVREAEFNLLTRRESPDGVGIVCEQRWDRLIDQHPAHGDVWVGLDSIRTPRNLGTILRTCAAVGAKGVMLIGGELDPYDPAVVRGSMGSLFANRLIRTSARALAGWKSRRNVAFIGTSPHASLDYRVAAYRAPLVLMMGSERSGLRERQAALCDTVVRLPMTSQVDSLNLAVAASIMLYEVTRGGAAPSSPARTARPRCR